MSDKRVSLDIELRTVGAETLVDRCPCERYDNLLNECLRDNDVRTFCCNRSDAVSNQREAKPGRRDPATPGLPLQQW